MKKHGFPWLIKIFCVQLKSSLQGAFYFNGIADSIGLNPCWDLTAGPPSALMMQNNED